MRLKKIPHASTFLKAQDTVIQLENVVKTETFSTIDTVEVEIGCGKGDFILARTYTYPKTKFYAIEKFDSVLYRAVEKQQALGKDTVTFVAGDAKDIEKLFPPESVHRIFLNFSDPWPKKRHAKRRLTYRDKLRQYQAVLKPGGVLEMKTDNQSLFESTLLELSQEGWLLLDVSCNVHADSRYGNEARYQTEYEKRFIAKGLPIYFIRTMPKQNKNML